MMASIRRQRSTVPDPSRMIESSQPNVSHLVEGLSAPEPRLVG